LARRFATLDHPDCKKFRRKCEEQGVDKAIWKDPDAWVIKAQRTVGGGNKAIEMAMITELRSLQPRLAPPAQRIIDQLAATAYTDNAGLALQLVPDADVSPSSSVMYATMAWGTLMQQQPVALTTAVDHKEYTSTLITLLFSAVQKATQAMQQTGQMPDMNTLMGYAFVSQTIQQEMQLISADKSSAEWTKTAMDTMAQINNELKALIQRVQQAMKAQQPQVDPKVAIETAKAQQEMQFKAQSHQLSLQNQAQEHALTLQHRQQEHAIDTAAKVQGIQQDNREHQVGIALDTAQAANNMEIKRGSAKQAQKLTANQE